ncbi:unnamed protein product [Cylindrotheca closterium]|uniref:Uncharacterized protein n=1 Tax=Cylindrotheca closterium TaxID=2856 RepID=A0AAD2JK49_9STRA|nr:unnamed protein product [Cylindrotheca closterium]
MEADPIIPAMLPSRQLQHNRHYRSEEEEEFPGDEGTSTLYKLNGGDGNKATINNSQPQRALKTSSGHASAANDPVRRLSNTSQGSRRQDSLNPASEGDDTPIGLRLLAGTGTGDDSPKPRHYAGSSHEDMNYIDIKSFQKNRTNSITRSQKSAKKTTAVDLSAYNMPENTMRVNRSSNNNNNNNNNNIEEERRQLAMEQEAFENSKAKHNAQMEKSMLDVDETIDTTQSSDQKFLSLEDVKGIFQDVKESRILNCVGDEALHGIDDGGGAGHNKNRKNQNGVYEENALLGRITSGLRDSLQMLSPAAAASTKKSGEIPMEIAIPMQHEDESGGNQSAIDTQVSELEKLEEENAGRRGHPPSFYSQHDYHHDQDEPAPAAKGPMMPPVAATPERAPESKQKDPLQQMSPLERKVSKVILKQMQAEDARLEKERAAIDALRKGTKAPENVVQGISFLRKKEQTRIQLEAAEAEAKAKKEKDEKHAQEVRKINHMFDDEYGDDEEFVEENDSQRAFGNLRKVLTHMYNPNGGNDNEITLEEYEKQVRANAPPSPPPMDQQEQSKEDLDVVHERSKGKKKKSSSIFKSLWKDSKSKSKKQQKGDGKKSSGSKKKSGFFSKRFKKSSTKKGEEEMISC